VSLVAVLPCVYNNRFTLSLVQRLEYGFPFAPVMVLAPFALITTIDSNLSDCLGLSKALRKQFPQLCVPANVGRIKYHGLPHSALSDKGLAKFVVPVDLRAYAASQRLHRTYNNNCCFTFSATSVILL
jgi:hypothetical protein